MSAPSILTAICCGEAERCQDVVTCRCQAAVRTTVIKNAKVTLLFSPLFCNLLLQVVSYGGHVRHLNCCKGGLNVEADSVCSRLTKSRKPDRQILPLALSCCGIKDAGRTT